MLNFKKTVLAAAFISMVPTASYAQLEEVLVTATKRVSSVQDLPFSINAMTEQDINRSGSTNIEELSRNVAGLTIQNLGPGQSQVAIRGVSAGQIVRDQPGVKEQVGVYIDETVISVSLFTPDLDLYDLNRVETLRGPQGTLFGSGSVGGTIRMITNQPSFDELAGSIEANLHTVSDGEEGGHLKGAVNIPMGDKLALRAVGYATEYAGFIDALGENGSKKKDVNSGYRRGARLALAWQATDNLLITPRVIYQEIEADGNNRQEVFNLFANPYTTTRPAIQLGEREQYLLLDEKFEDETLIADLVVNWALDNLDLTYAGSYTERDILVVRDASALSGSVGVDVGFDDAGVLLPSSLNDVTDLEQWTHEFRVASNSEGPINWVAGVFYSDVDREYNQRLPTPGHDAATIRSGVLGDTLPSETMNGFAGPDSPYNASIPYSIKQKAVFGEATWDVNERLHLTLGGRWYDFEETRTFTSGGWFANGDFSVDSTQSDGFNPRVMASYDINDNTIINAQASQGFRLGGVNDPLNASLCNDDDLATFNGFPGYDDETLWNYELGFKSMFDKVQFNAAIFYTDIENLQTTVDAGSCSSRVVFEVPKAHTAGVEWEMTAYPVNSLLLTFNGSYIEAEFDSTLTNQATGAVLAGIKDGNRLASVPKLQLSAAATYTFKSDLFGSSEMYVTALVQHVGERFTQPSDQVNGAGEFQSGLPWGGASGNEITSLDLELDSYEQLNLSAGMLWDDWEAVLYVHNATDENNNLSFDRERGGRARLAFRTNQPRTIGLTVRRSF
ncbi:TonB-dependent receptor [Parahaliea sp. F7430]|uniref:TonB-dependent receptor n=1 Tax=Sediminihaliea albiluteola TaxID=2758564 RepID=A0A7W2YJ07_9GAMM|nr:TonB-dependent receptor [Sediminihaliea albiluteola]MBA6411798.1 TonB-dependent receptor [Sediminihaliea albiluteola]